MNLDLLIEKLDSPNKIIKEIENFLLKYFEDNKIKKYEYIIAYFNPFVEPDYESMPELTIFNYRRNRCLENYLSLKYHYVDFAKRHKVSLREFLNEEFDKIYTLEFIGSAKLIKEKIMGLIRMERDNKYLYSMLVATSNYNLEKLIRRISKRYGIDEKKLWDSLILHEVFHIFYKDEESVNKLTLKYFDFINEDISDLKAFLN